MMNYTYQAVDKKGKTLKGTITAGSREEAIAQLKQKGLVILDIEEKGPQRVKRSGSFGRSKQQFLISFTQQLADLLKAGIQLDDALSVLIQLTGNEEYRQKIIQIQQDIQGGADLSQALGKHPRLFNESYINMIRAGEQGGVLGLCAQRLTDYLEQDRELRSSILSSLIYPIVVLFMGLAAVVVLFIFVIPKFLKLFDSMDQELPFLTQILLGISGFFQQNWLVILIALVVGGFVFLLYRQSSEGRYQLDRLKTRLPFFGDIQVKLTVSRFTRILGTMLESGVPLLKGLDIAKDTLTNQVFVKLITGLHEEVRKGGTLVAYLQQQPEFPELAIFLIGVGERTGNLEEMLQRVGETLAREVKQSLENFLAIFEPMVILLLGLFVLFIVMSILLPIFSLQQMPF